MIQAGAQAVDGWAKDNGFTVLFCSGNLALREMYENLRSDTSAKIILVDRTREKGSTGSDPFDRVTPLTVRTSSGDIAAEFEQEAEAARRFLGHPLTRVREWVADMVEAARRQAADWRQRDEEMVGA